MDLQFICLNTSFLVQRTVKIFDLTKNVHSDEMYDTGMSNFVPAIYPDPIEEARQTNERRKLLQLANKKTYDDAIVLTRQRLKDLEVQEMREVIQDKINIWLNANRLEETGFFPYLPKPAHGGSKDIIDPPLKLDMPMDEKKKKGAKVPENKTKKTKGMLNIDDHSKKSKVRVFAVRKFQTDRKKFKEVNFHQKGN